LRVRGALLLGGDSATRRQNYRVLHDSYDVRSKVVHDGVIANPKQLDAREKVKAGQAICVQLLLALIRSGEFPDWDALMLDGMP
jgi:hypothetical protein